ncbi:MAG: formylglycine-generating enzyme family protein, partial [Planctomycetia bacterium]|nr:formylglycine-generating enzyme family protein [Planctomycetia bacterium]
RTQELARRCRDESDKPCVQQPRVSCAQLPSFTLLTNLRREGLTPTRRQEIITEEERFEEYLVASDFERAQDCLTTLAGYYPEGTASEKYQTLSQTLAKKKEEYDKRQEAEDCYANAQSALQAKNFAEALTYIDDAIELYKDSKYTTFRNGALTRGVRAAVNQSITDGNYQKAESLNKLLAQLDAKTAKENESRIAELEQPKPVTPEAGALKTLTIAGVKVNFRWAPAGTFQMGSPESEEERYSGNWEKQHTVTLSKGFWIAETETTQELWEAVMGNNPSYFTGDKQLPVEEVSWNDCQEFVEKLNASYSSALPSGYKYAMPTEAQWEYACRAGTTTPFNFGSVLNGDKANCDGNYPYGTSTKGAYKAKTTPVKSYAANAWGLYDMHGNVLEWCADWSDEDYYTSSSATTDPAGPGSGSDRVFRGGSWFYSAECCRSASRRISTPEIRGNDYGFRLVLVR